MFCCCIALLIAAQSSVTDTLWTENTEQYSISVYYPDIALENEAVGERLEEYASGQIQAFKDNFEECFSYNPLVTGWILEICFTHEPSPDSMICIMTWRWSYTGGAHGNTWTQGFIFDQVTDSIMGPVELLGGQAAFEAFADEVLVQLSDMLDDDGDWVKNGSSATIENYHSVLPVPDENGGIEGYTVIFPPYQVTCYAYGTFKVFVPVE